MSNLNDALLADLLHDGDFEVSASGDLITINGLQNIEQALFHRLITSPGTLIHRPTYGVGIKDFQNSLTSIDNQASLATRITEQFQQDPRVVSVDGISIDIEDGSQELVTVIVNATVIGYDEQTFEFQPFGVTVP